MCELHIRTRIVPIARHTVSTDCKLEYVYISSCASICNIWSWLEPLAGSLWQVDLVTVVSESGSAT